MGPAPPRLLLLLVSLFVGRARSQDGYCDGLPDFRTVSTAAEASALGADLTRCQGLEFTVTWKGTVSLSEPLQVTNSTTLQITGESKEESVVSGDGGITLFVVSELSVLYLQAIALTGGYGVDGGAVAAVGASSVMLMDCDVYGNRVTSNGGRYCVVRRRNHAPFGLRCFFVAALQQQGKQPFCSERYVAVFVAHVCIVC